MAWWPCFCVSTPPGDDSCGQCTDGDEVLEWTVVMTGWIDDQCSPGTFSDCANGNATWIVDTLLRVCTWQDTLVFQMPTYPSTAAGCTDDPGEGGNLRLRLSKAGATYTLDVYFEQITIAGGLETHKFSTSALGAYINGDYLDCCSISSLNVPYVSRTDNSPAEGFGCDGTGVTCTVTASLCAAAPP